MHVYSLQRFNIKVYNPLMPEVNVLKTYDSGEMRKFLEGCKKAKSFDLKIFKWNLIIVLLRENREILL